MQALWAIFYLVMLKKNVKVSEGGSEAVLGKTALGNLTGSDNLSCPLLPTQTHELLC